MGRTKACIGMIPGLENADLFVMVSCTATYINSPELLNSTQKEPRLFLAIKMTGVEGYLESGCGGRYGWSASGPRYLGERSFIDFKSNRFSVTIFLTTKASNFQTDECQLWHHGSMASKST